MNNIKNYAIIILVVLVSILTCERRTQEPITIVKTDTITKVETKIETDTVTIEVVKPTYITKYVEIPAEVDSAEILRDYFKQVMYNDTIIDSDKGLVYLEELICKNRIVDRKVSYKFFNNTVTKYITNETTIVPKPKWSMQLQSVFIPTPNSVSVVPGITLLNPKGFGAGVHYDVVNKNIGVSVSYKLF